MKRVLPLICRIAPVVLVCGTSAARASDVSAQAWVDSTRYTVGDWITVHVDLRHPKGIALQPALGDTLGEYRVIKRIPAILQTDTSEVTGVVLARFEAGTAPIPPLTYYYILPGDTAPHTVMTRPLPVTVSLVAVDTTKDIRDLKPPLSIPITIAEIALYAAAIILLGGIVYLLYWLWNRRKKKLSGEAYVAPPRAAHVIAFEQLALLKEKKLWQQGLIKEYYSEATDILRRYIENRYHQPALEETTDEIMTGLQRLRFTPDLIGAMERILRRADLVKFAKFRPDVPDHEETVAVVYDVVDRTKIVTMTPVSATEARTQVNVG